MQAGRGKLSHTHFSSMFWQKHKFWDQHWITVVTKDNNSLFITCPKYYFKDGFVVFVKGDLRKTAENNSSGVPFKELRLAIDSIFSVTVV